MSKHSDIIIAGAGLAGISSALWLSKDYKVVLVDSSYPKASAIAAGMVNPFAGRRARPIWHADQALEDLNLFLEHAQASKFYTPSRILRPANSYSQAFHYQYAADNYPNHCAWLNADVAKESYPYLNAHHGLLVTSGGFVDVPRLLNSALRTLETQGCTVRRGTSIQDWGESKDLAFVEFTSGERLEAHTVLLALGSGYTNFPRLSKLNLHPVKGQIIQTSVPCGLELDHPICGQGYIVPMKNRLTLGTTYERGFIDHQPTAEATKSIIGLTSNMIPAINSCHVVSATAAIRVGVPGQRLPMVGAIGARIWVFTGLGSKGLLYAPHIARNLPQYLTDPHQIPSEIRVH